METPKFLQEIRWSLLRQQKDSLICAIEKAEQTGNDEFTDDLNGILSLIDAVQDYAVDKMGCSEEQVFNLENSEK